MLRAAAAELTGQAAVFSFHKSITICYIDFTKSAGLKKLMSKNIVLLFLRTLQCLQLSTFGRKTNGGFGCLTVIPS